VPGIEPWKTPAPGQAAGQAMEVWAGGRMGETRPFQNFLGKPLDLFL
jgi:hypothetical protein